MEETTMVDDYNFPKSLKQYFMESKTIKAKLSPTVLEAIEDNHVRLSNFYDFNESEFGEITVDCLSRFKSEETFGWFLNQNLKEKMDMNIKGTKVQLDKINELLDENINFSLNKLMETIIKFKEDKTNSFNYDNQQSFEIVHSICNFIIFIKEKNGLDFQEFKNKMQELNLADVRKEMRDKRLKFENERNDILKKLSEGFYEITHQMIKERENKK